MTNLELDAEVESKCFGSTIAYGEIVEMEPDPNGGPNITDHWPIPAYTTDPAASMELLKWCVEKMRQSVVIDKVDGEWTCWAMFSCGDELCTKAETLELAVARFALKLAGGGK
jgi:hypothetical protein